MKKNLAGDSSESEESSIDEMEQDSDQESEADEQDLAASSTDSDVDDSESDSDDETTAGKTKSELIGEQIHNKYEQVKGTRLYVRFPQKLPLDEDEFQSKAKALSPLIIKAHKPRQKHARFCLVDFNSKEDRDAALEAIKSAAKTSGVFASVPKTESDEFVKDLIAKKQQSLENKKTKSLMKRATKKVQRKEIFTSSVVITNLPKSTSTAQLRTLFESAVDIQIKPGKGKFRDAFSAATITLPSTHDARKAIKQDLSIAGTKLKLRFNTQLKKKKKPQSKKKLKQKPEAEEGKISLE